MIKRPLKLTGLNMIAILQTLRDTVIAGKLYRQLEAMIAGRKPFDKRRPKAA